MTSDFTKLLSEIKRPRPRWVNLQGLISCSVTHLNKSSCTSISLLGEGSYNAVYRITFNDGFAIAASVSTSDDEDFNLAAKKSEIATMKFIRKSGIFTDLPVPEVYAYDLSFSNAAHAPYVIMQLIEGTTLNHLENDEGLSGLDAMAPKDQLVVVKTLAKIQAALRKQLPFNEIGSITMDDSENFSVGPLITLFGTNLGGPYQSIKDLWRARLTQIIETALEEWTSHETDELSQSPDEPQCTTQKFSKIIQKISALIPHFAPPEPYLQLVLHHPDLALRNVFLDPQDYTKIVGIIDWGGACVVPLMFSAHFPDDLQSDGSYPYDRQEPAPEGWNTVPYDWTSLDQVSKRPAAYSGSGEPVDFTPKSKAIVRRFYLRQYFSAGYAEHVRNMYGDKNLARATLFADAQYYLKFHEIVTSPWTRWVEQAEWIRETYWRLRAMRQEARGTELIIGPNVYRGSVKALIYDLGLDDEGDIEEEEIVREEEVPEDQNVESNDL